MQSLRNNPIGVFDSGFGGLTVLKELQKAFPHEHFIYLGDTARLPYGTKSTETITRYALESCNYLASQNVKMIVVACNTGAAMASDTLSSHFTLPIVDVINPVIEEIVKNSKSGRIGILATRATVNSKVYETKIHLALPTASITAVPAPLLVSLVEEGYINHPMTEMAIQEYLEPLFKANVDTVVLACTHFPLLKNQIKKVLGDSIQVIDPAFAATEAAKKKLLSLDLLNSVQNFIEPTFYVTDDPEKFKRLAPAFLNSAALQVNLCQLSEINSGPIPFIINKLYNTR